MKLLRFRVRPFIPSVAVVLAAGVGSLFTVQTIRHTDPSVRPAQGRSGAQVKSVVSELPLYFIENMGQAHPAVDHYIQGSRTSAYFTATGVTLALPARRETRRWAVRQQFLGAEPVRALGRDATSAVVSYFTGSRDQWKTGIATHSSIIYRDLWPGVDLKYEGTEGRLKYTFRVEAGADPSDIRLAYRGAHSVRLNAAGQLEVRTPIGAFQDDRPVAWQRIEGRRTPVPVAYDVGESGAYSFRLGEYDRTRPLVIDPAVLIYAGFMGGSSSDEGNGIAVDPAGAAYVTGKTMSPATSFPEKVGPDLIHNGNTDAFVAKVNPSGTSLVYAGYIGGSGNDDGRGIDVVGGEAYITGATESNATTFPVTVGPDLVHNGGTDAFVARVNSNGTGLSYAGYIGGSENDEGRAIDVIDGQAHIAGGTESTAATFPAIVGPDLVHNGGTDAFVARVKSDGTGLSYAGYIGGSDYEVGQGISVDNSMQAHVVGTTASTQADFPVAGGGDLTYNGGPHDVFVAEVKANGSALTHAGYMGGSDDDSAHAVAVHRGTGATFVTGHTRSANFPVSEGPDLTHAGGGNDAFVAKLGANGAVKYSGFIGGSGNDVGNGIAVSRAGAVFIAGKTSSTAGSFPEVVGPDLAYNGGPYDAFVAQVTPDGTDLTYAGYIGGSAEDSGFGIALDRFGVAYVAGRTKSTQSTFPEKQGPDLTHNGAGTHDAFVAKVALQNLLKNGDFEVDANGDDRPDNWTSDPRFARSDARQLTGTYAGAHAAGADSTFTIQQSTSNVTAGQRYNFEGYTNITPTDDAFSLKLQIRWRNSSGGTIDTTTFKTYSDDTAGKWSRAAATAVAPTGTASAVFRMVVQSLDTTIYVDHFVLYR